MKDTQKRFLGAVLAASSVVGVVAPSVTAMATVVDDENKATAEDLKAVIAEYTTKLEENTIFANYHRVIYAAERLAQYDAAASEAAKASIAQYADKVFTAEVKTILDKMDGFAKGKSMADYNELVTKEIKAMTNKENADYLMSRLDVWGKAVVFEVDPNYVKATDAIIAAAKLVSDGKYDDAAKQVVVAKDAIKAIKTYDVNGAYLEGQLKIQEDILAQKASLKVVSAEAINATEVKVVFNKEVDEDSAISESNYTLYVGQDTTAAQVNLKEGELQADNKSVILQLDNNAKIENGQSYKVEAKNIVDTNGKTVEAYKGDFAIFNDKTAPALVATEYTGSTVKFTFDKPVKNPSNVSVKIDSTTISGAKTFSTKAGEYELTVNLGTSTKAQDLGKHIVKLSGVTDYADNTADMITTEYTATEDNEKPVVKSIEEDSQDTFKVTFNTSVANLQKSNFEIKKGNHTFTATQIANVDNSKLVSDKECYVTLVNATTGDNRLYEDGETKVDLSVKVKDYQGTNTKMGEDFTTNVTLSKDETAPTVNEVLNRVDGNDTLVVYFNEDLKDAQVVVTSKISIVRDGIKETVKQATVDGKKLQITLQKSALDAAKKDLETGKYSITLEKGAVVDKADNKNEAVTTTVNYTNDNADRANVTPAALTSRTADNNKNVITVNFTTKMNDSALDLSNYMIDGTKLSDAMYAGTTVAFTDSTNKDSVEITLVKGTVDETVANSKTLKLSKDLKTDKGEYIARASDDKEVTQTVSLQDDTNPAVDKVEFITNASADTTTKVLRVKFTEKVTTPGAIEAEIKDDFIVRDASGNKIEIANIAIDPANQDTIVIKLTKDVSINKTLTLEVTDNKSDNAKINVFDQNTTLVNELETGKFTAAGKEVNPTIFGFFK